MSLRLTTKRNVTARKAGTATVTVKVAENVTAVCKVTVISRVTGISLSETTVELKPGETHQLTATVLPQNASNAEVTWYSDKESVATVSQSGLVTGVGPGETTVHAVTTDGGKMASCLVKVGTPVKGITLSVSSKTLYVGDRFIGHQRDLDSCQCHRQVSRMVKFGS